MIVLIVVARRGMLPDAAMPVLHSLDLPLLFIAMLFGGSSLYVSLTKEAPSRAVFVVIFFPLAVIFGVFCWLNFGFPYPNY